MRQSLILDDPLDMHLHLRDEEMLRVVAPLSAKSFAGAIIMPNLVPPVTTKEMLLSYRDRIIEAIKGEERFTPYMTLFFRSDYDYKFLEALKDELTAIKLYPAGITTNSEGGVSGFDIDELRPTLEAMSELNIPLAIHGESSGFVLDREREFIPIYDSLATAFPKLTIIMEHITTKESVKALQDIPNLYATITLHHLMITLDDVAGGLLKPHLFCKPIAKRYEDREALLDIALSGNPKVMFGSDSAPHPKSAKECSGCAAGVFTAPIALEALAGLFEKSGSLDNLQKFISSNAKEIYKITPPKKRVKLVKKEKIVPDSYGEVVPFMAKQSLSWSIESIE